jgi:hypothetical protein
VLLTGLLDSSALDTCGEDADAVRRMYDGSADGRALGLDPDEYRTDCVEKVVGRDGGGGGTAEADLFR